ncbi:hypothetical protein BRADI_4g38012v3 [Brachypodium distachyon]|uniref:Uncharacterized protein n=1 Tax=Brachypodium distachyon TaxID=15368 RepID=A0A0Q3IZF7_BRADI|nr:hypothetical protein BRADI_4g38012v3 [Brachypodium distachyon]KQJ91488.1 hypothetical protein BRADI_4g38012v3 [Brachypodium distachyon]PNT65166.1 hypothetical protein BRADI_4g38012v3 [Brachypodium distachyon]
MSGLMIKQDITMASYVVWNIWKERNRGIFKGKSMSPFALSGLIREDRDPSAARKVYCTAELLVVISEVFVCFGFNLVL